MLKIEQEQTAEAYTICRPVDELDAFTVGQFRQALGDLAPKVRMIIHMSGVPFVDSAGLEGPHRWYPAHTGAGR